jgi:hypothetical protein
VVPPASHKISRVSWYSGSRYERAQRTSTGLSPALVALSNAFKWSCSCDLAVLQPRLLLRADGLGYLPVRSPLLRESRLISFRRATEMFQFAHCPRTSLCVQLAVSRHHSGWVAPFGYIRLIAWMQLPLYVSPVSASFIGKQRQGIHLVLCVACCYTPSRGVLPRKGDDGFSAWFSVFISDLVQHGALSKIEGISVQLEMCIRLRVLFPKEERHASRTMRPQPLESGNQ